MDYALAQYQLVRELEAKGIRDPRVLEAVGRVPRQEFVPEEERDQAYDDCALPIAAGQTISQPYIVALMTQELVLTGTEKVLEIGTGSGYQTAILAGLCREVVTVERLPELADRARQVLERLGIGNVQYHIGDGTLGAPAGAPYDGILVTAAAPKVPPALYAQLQLDGRLVMPVGPEGVQALQVIVRKPEKPLVLHVCDCSFVKLIGAEGWQESGGPHT